METLRCIHNKSRVTFGVTAVYQKDGVQRWDWTRPLYYDMTVI